MDASEVKEGNYYRLDVEAYRKWYRENVRSGVFMFSDVAFVQVMNEPEYRDDEWRVGFREVNSLVAVGSAPVRFLVPTTNIPADAK